MMLFPLVLQLPMQRMQPLMHLMQLLSKGIPPPIIGSPFSVVMKNGAIENNTMTTVDNAIALADVFSDCTAVSIGTFTLL